MYTAQNGRAPFSEWLASLRDGKARAKIRVRLDRVSLGNLGDCRGEGGGVHELRIDYGPGYRVYFGQIGHTIVLLLCGGDKTRRPTALHRRSNTGAITGVSHEKKQSLSGRLN
ncbi:MAG: type II toxin-antitoxin system RelE/ParE family toxin [Nitrospira sp.]|nr:type II toxin-antitoxin system RelE/ParE family toxin [Nitrospira sp.]